MSEYAPVSSDIMMIVAVSHRELDKIGGNRRISASKLIEGGADMFAAQAKNHQIVMDGKIANRPLVRNILRVPVVSYDEFAMQNRADEDNP